MMNSVFVSQDSLLASICGVTAEKNPDAYANWTEVAFYLSPIFVNLAGATLNFFAIYVAALFGYFLAQSYGDKPIHGALIGLASFLLLQPLEAGLSAGGANTYYLGATGIIISMFAGLVAPTIFHYVAANKKLRISMPDGVPPAVASSFSALIPFVITLFAFGAIQPIWGAFAYGIGFGKEDVAGVNQIVANGSFWVKYSIVDSADVSVQFISDELTLWIYEGSNLFNYLTNFGESSTVITPDNFETFNKLLFDEIQSQHSDWIISGISFTELTEPTDSSWISSLTDGDEIYAGLNFSESVVQGSGSTQINGDWYYLFNTIQTIIVDPLTDIATSWYGIIIICILMGLFWFVGIHGTNVMSPVVEGIWGALTVANIAILNSVPGSNVQVAIESGALNLWTKASMDAYMFIGGSGATLGLIVGVMIFSKNASTKEISKIALAPGCFNINEPMIFGTPLVLNFVYAIPFIFLNAIQGLVVWGFLQLGWVNPSMVMVPWTTPVFLQGIFITMFDWRSVVLTILTVAIAIGAYFPFVLIDSKGQADAADKKLGKTKKQKNKKTKENNSKIEEPVTQSSTTSNT